MHNNLLICFIKKEYIEIVSLHFRALQQDLREITLNVGDKGYLVQNEQIFNINHLISRKAKLTFNFSLFHNIIK